MAKTVPTARGGGALPYVSSATRMMMGMGIPRTKVVPSAWLHPFYQANFAVCRGARFKSKCDPAADRR